MRNAFFAFWILALIGCGTSSELPTPPVVAEQPQNLWGQEKLESLTEQCARNGEAHGGDYQQYQVFCRCVYSEAAKRWDFDTFVGDISNKLSQLQAEMAACAKTAGGN